MLARADQGRLPLRLEPLDVQDLIERRRPSRGTAGTVAVGIPGGAVVLADADRVAQALDNLLTNAGRYGRPSRSPWSPASRTRRWWRSRSATRATDSPPRFPPDAFERFSQADPGHGGDGSGLGLAIVDAIARAHGGHAIARAVADGGFEVAVTLPRA